MKNTRSAQYEVVPPEEAARAPVTRREVTADLRRMILATADHIGMVGPPGCVAAFLGFEVGPWAPEEYLSLDPASVDLDLYRLTPLVDRAYDFAWQVGPRQNRVEFGQEAFFVLVNYLHGAPTFSSDLSNTPMGSRSALRQTLEAARARQHLGWEVSLSIGDLALLARMTEPAVRASLSKEGIRTTGSKNTDGLSSVEHGEALPWLAKRRGYVPTETSLANDPDDIDRDVADIFRNHGWGAVVVDATRIQGLAALAKVQQVDPDWLMDVVQGRPAAVDIGALERIGQVVAQDVPRFVGSTVERLMRAAAHASPAA